MRKFDKGCNDSQNPWLDLDLDFSHSSMFLFYFIEVGGFQNTDNLDSLYFVHSTDWYITAWELVCTKT